MPRMVLCLGLVALFVVSPALAKPVEDTASLRSEGVWGEAPPATVAVLPFELTYDYDLAKGEAPPESHSEGVEILRETFARTFASLPFQDVPVREVDGTLAQHGIRGAEGLGSVSPQDLGKWLQVDAVLMGEVTRVNNMTSPLFTETLLEARVRLVSTRDGSVLWEEDGKKAVRGGVIMQKGQVVDFVQNQIDNRKTELAFLKVSEKLSQKLIEKFPEVDPASVPSADRKPTWSSGEETAGRIPLVILPLAVQDEDHAEGAELLRMNLAARLGGAHFDVIEFGRIDSEFKARGFSAQNFPSADDAIDLAKAAGGKAVLMGEVTRWGRMYMGIESQVYAGMKLELVDCETGVRLWELEDQEKRSAGLSKIPTGLSSAAMSPIMGLRDKYMIECANDLSRGMADDLLNKQSVMVYAQRFAR